jgi:hypothetical protein
MPANSSAILQVIPSGKYAILQLARNNEDNDIEIIDISDPANPRLLGGMFTDGPNFGLVGLKKALGNYVYFTRNSAGLDILDISDPTNPHRVWHSAAAAFDLSLAGDYAYVASGVGGLQILDITNPAQPVEVSATRIPSKTPWTCVAVSGNFAWLTGRSGPPWGIQVTVLDISNPARPLLLGMAGREKISEDAAMSPRPFRNSSQAPFCMSRMARGCWFLESTRPCPKFKRVACPAR